MLFKTRVRELREAAGYKSQQSFADSFGVAQSTVGNWEAGKREPNYETTLRLADFFGTTVDYLMGRTSQNSIKKEPTVKDDGLSEVERAFISLSPQRQEEVLRYMEYLASQESGQ